MRSKYSSRFLYFAVLCTVVLAMQGTAGPHVQEMRGVFEGYIQSESNPPDPVRFEITAQQGRRFTGLAEPPDPGQPIAIEGTVSASGRVNYQGKSPDAHIIGNLDLHEFGDGGAIQVGTQKVSPKTGGLIIPCVLVMRAFAGDGSVVPGDYTGELDGGGEIRIGLSARTDPDRPSTRFGTVEVTIDGETHTFDMIASSSESGRFIAIGHNPTGAGHLIIDGVLASPPEPVRPSLVGTITIELDHGHQIESSFAAQRTVIVEGPVS